MRRLALIIATALSACAPCWAAFTSPPWPSGTNYYIAGTNKDNRIRQIEQAINERELVLGITNSPSTTAQFYTHEREYCIEAKSWIAAHAGDFVDYTRTTASNITYWTTNTLIADCGLPTNFFSYTPWQALNGVGYGYTNEYTASNYTTLAYGYAGLTNLMKRLVQITRVGTWIQPFTNSSLWGKGWLYISPADWGGQAQKDDVVYFPEAGPGSQEVMIPFWSDMATAISEAESFVRAEAYIYSAATESNRVDFEYLSGNVTDLEAFPPFGVSGIWNQTNSFESSPGVYVDGWNAQWGLSCARNETPMYGSASAGWRLYIAGRTEDSTYLPGTLSGARSYSDFGINLATSLTQYATGYAASVSAISPPIGVTSLVMQSSFYPTNLVEGGGNLFVILVDQPPLDSGDTEGDSTTSFAAEQGFQVYDWITILDYGATNGFLRK